MPRALISNPLLTDGLPSELETFTRRSSNSPDLRSGAMIVDQSDKLAHKAHFISDRDWEEMLDAMDEAIESSASGARNWEAACMRIRQRMGDRSRLAWQCAACRRIYVNDRTYVAREFVPTSPEPSRELFRGSGS